MSGHVNSKASCHNVCYDICRPKSVLGLADVAAVKEALSDACAVAAVVMKGANFGSTEQVCPVPTFCTCCLLLYSCTEAMCL